MPKDRYTVPRIGTKIAEIRDMLVQPGGVFTSDMAYLYNNTLNPESRVNHAMGYLDIMCGYTIVYKEIKAVGRGRPRHLNRITALLNWDGTVAEDYIAEEI